MPFSRPSLQQLQSQALADVLTQSGTVSLLRRSVLRAQSWAQAGLAWLHYGYLDWISRNSVPFTATGEYVQAWGALVAINPKPASAASGLAVFSGVIGKTIDAFVILTRGDGAAYQTTASGVIGSNGIATVPIVALLAGSAGNADISTAVTLSSPASGVNPGGLTSTQLGGGVDPEADGDYRARMLQRYAEPPQGGSVTDYVGWAEATPGVTRAWVTPNGAGTGTVLIYTMFDNVEAAHGGLPQGTNGVATGETRDVVATGDQLTVANQIAPVRPVTALVYSLAPVAYPVAFVIGDLDPATDAIKLKIITALAGVFRRNAAPGGTLFPMTFTNADNGTMFPSEFTAAIASVAGVRRFTLVAPAVKIIAPKGNIPTLGATTWA